MGRTIKPKESNSGLSDQWRINKASSQKQELIEVLRSLRKVVKYNTGKNLQLNYNIEEADQEKEELLSIKKRTPVDQITINPDIVLQSQIYPLAESNFDVRVGINSHETAHHNLRSHEIISEQEEEASLYTIVALLGE